MNLIQVESMKRIILSFLCILLVISACGCDNEKLYNKAVGSVVALTVTNSKGSCIGTGFFALEPDIIVTCYHVVEGATNITAKNNKGDIISIEGIIDYSKEKDIALLKASSKNSSVLELQANMPTPGTPAYALGSPQGLDFSFSDGVISQIRRGKETLIQFTCPVSSGNSGGPLLAEDGKVLGIVSCQLTEGQNLNFAVPSASLYMLNKDNAVRKIKKNNYIEIANSDELSSDEAEEKAMEHLELGEKYAEAHLYDEAEKELSLALKIKPNDLQVLYSLCNFYDKSKNYNKLKVVAEKGIQTSIKNSDTRFLGIFYFNLCRAYFESQDYDKTIEFCELIINKYLDEKYWNNIEDNNFFKYIKLGVYSLNAACYALKNDYKKTIYNCNKSLEYCEKNEEKATINGMIGASFYELKDYKSAQEYAKKALKIDPNNKDAKELLEKCKKQLRKK